MMRKREALRCAFEIVAETLRCSARAHESAKEYDRELAEATAVVERVFPGARLVKFTQWCFGRGYSSEEHLTHANYAL